MRQKLIAASTKGVYHSEFIQAVRTKAFPAVTIREILEDWRSRGLIDKYYINIPTSKKPVIVWRANRNIIDGRL